MMLPVGSRAMKLMLGLRSRNLMMWARSSDSFRPTPGWQLFQKARTASKSSGLKGSILWGMG